MFEECVWEDSNFIYEYIWLFFFPQLSKTGSSADSWHHTSEYCTFTYPTFNKTRNQSQRWWLCCYGYLVSEVIGVSPVCSGVVKFPRCKRKSEGLKYCLMSCHVPTCQTTGWVIFEVCPGQYFVCFVGIYTIVLTWPCNHLWLITLLITCVALLLQMHKNVDCMYICSTEGKYLPGHVFSSTVTYIEVNNILNSCEI